MVVRFPLHLLKQAAIRSAYNDKKEAEQLSAAFASELTGIQAIYGYPKFPEDKENEENSSCNQRLD